MAFGGPSRAHAVVAPCWAAAPVGAINLLGPVGAIDLLGSVGARFPAAGGRGVTTSGVRIKDGELSRASKEADFRYASV